MSFTVLVSELQEQVRLDCGLPVYTTNTNISTALILDFVKRSARKCYAIAQRAGADQHYFTTQSSLSTVVGVATVALPSNAQDVVRVAMVDTQGREVMLEPAALDDWDPTAQGMSAYLDIVPRYRVIGDTIKLFPTPQTVRTLRVDYTIGFTVASTASSLAVRPFWDEYMVANCCVLVRNRQSQACPEFITERDAAAGAITQTIKRDRAGPRQIRDVAPNFFDSYGRRRRGLNT
jgi:hypothetical protein